VNKTLPDPVTNPLIPKPPEAPPQKPKTVKATRTIPAPLWAKAFALYCSGELASIAAVADFLGIRKANVWQKSHKEGWQQARHDYAQRIKDRVTEGSGVEIVGERLEQDRLELASVQSELARSLLGHGRSLAGSLAVFDPIMDQARNRALADPRPETAEALRALSGHHAETMETLRVLAGIPHPDKTGRRVKDADDAQGEDKPKALRVDDVSPISSGTNHGPMDSAGEGGEGGGGS
jgi:hypothetical protein